MIDWDRAIQILKERGRCKGDFVHSETKNVCAMEAVYASEGYSGLNWAKGGQEGAAAVALEMTDVLRPIIAAEFPDRLYRPVHYHPSLVPTVAHFNDHADTTDEDVFLIFEKARANA